MNVKNEIIRKSGIDKNVQLAEDTENLKAELLKWFRMNPNPSDKQVHAFAVKKGINEHKFEETIYRLVTDYAKMSG